VAHSPGTPISALHPSSTAPATTERLTIPASGRVDGTDMHVPFDLQIARVRLTQFIIDKAKETEERVGFGFTPVQNAPSTYSQLRAAFARSQATGEPLPVSDQFCGSTTFLTPRHNVLFRFWHDVSHVERGLSFVHSDELELALWHLCELEAYRYDKDTLTYRLFEADTVGALMVKAISGRFAWNQLEFAMGCAEHGLTAGVQLELGRVPSLPTTSLPVAAHGARNKAHS